MHAFDDNPHNSADTRSCVWEHQRPRGEIPFCRTSAIFVRALYGCVIADEVPHRTHLRKYHRIMVNKTNGCLRHGCDGLRRALSDMYVYIYIYIQNIYKTYIIWTMESWYIIKLFSLFDVVEHFVFCWFCLVCVCFVLWIVIFNAFLGSGVIFCI